MRGASRPLRQDRLDTLVWRELVRLLDDRALIRADLRRRLGPDAIRTRNDAGRRDCEESESVWNEPTYVLPEGIGRAGANSCWPCTVGIEFWT